jgi:NAD(P)H-flavin reductase
MRQRPGDRAELSGPLGNSWAAAAAAVHATASAPGPSPAAAVHATAAVAVPAAAAIAAADAAAAIADVAVPAAALVGGGVGVAPLACYARELSAGGGVYDFYAGFRGGSYGLEGVGARSLVIASEDGSEGRTGRIPDFFSPEGYGAVFVCGPEALMRIVAAACAAAHTPCYVSLERRMACGAGACLGCTVVTRRGNRRCCADGPVFNAEDVYFEPSH